MTNQDIEEMLEQAEQALRKDKYKETEKIASKVIESLAQEDVTDLRDLTIDKLLTNAYRVLSESLWHQGLAKDSLPIAEKALNIAIITNNKEDIATSLGNIGIIYAHLSDFSKALEFMLDALKIHKEIGNERNAAGVIGNIGTVYRFISDYPRALKYYIDAINFHEAVGNKADASKIISNAGVVYEFLSDFPKALEYYEKALSIHIELGMKSSIANALNSIGIVHKLLSNNSKALDYYSKALTIHEELGNKLSAADVLYNIGNLYLVIMNYEFALEYFNNALSIQEKLGNKGNVAKTLGSIGIIYAETKNYNQALEFYNKAHIVYNELGMKTEIAILKCNMANVHLIISEYQISHDLYIEAYSEYEDLEDEYGLAVTISNIAVLLTKKEFKGYDLEKAEAYMFKAIKLYNKIGIKNDLYESHQSLADLYKQQKRWEEYATHIEKYHELYIEVQNEEVKKQADKFGWERKIAEMEKQKEIELLKTEAEKMNMQIKIESQTRELDTSLQEIIKKNNLLQLVQSSIKKIRPFTRGEGIQHVEQLHDRVTRSIAKLETISELDKQWADVHGAFMKKLQDSFPELTTMELKIAALIRMKLSSSNMASVLFLSQRTVESHRHSLRKKMGISASDNIYTKLSKYSES